MPDVAATSRRPSSTCSSPVRAAIEGDRRRARSRSGAASRRTSRCAPRPRARVVTRRRVRAAVARVLHRQRGHDRRCRLPPAPESWPEPSSMPATPRSPWRSHEPRADRRARAGPARVFAAWHGEAATAMSDPDAVALATASRTGAPSVRSSCFRGIDRAASGSTRDYDSRKGREIDENPPRRSPGSTSAAARQVASRARVVLDGAQRRTPTSRAATRPPARRARVTPVPSGRLRPTSSAAYAEAAARFEGRDAIARALGRLHAAGERVELWVQRDDRLHDQFAYTRDAGGWSAERIAP